MRATKNQIAALVAIAGASSVVAADISQNVFTLTARNANGEATYNVRAEDIQGDGNGQFWWTLDAPVDMGGIAMLEEGSLTIIEDPQVSLNFVVAAGVQDTIFTLSSALVSFADLSQAEGRAAASVTLTDVNGDGATLQGIGDGGSAYTSQYNGQFPTGTTFADLLPGSLTTGAFGTESFSENFPNDGFTPINEDVSNINSAWQFSLSQFDVATGTSIFVVTPAPGAAALLALGGVFATRRRR